MGNVHIVSTLKNKELQKKAVHHSSSTVFFAVHNPDNGIDTEVSLLNHFLLKRGISDVVATIEIRELSGNLICSFKESFDKERVYSWKLSKFIKSKFIGSISVYFNSNENLAVPFCAVTSAIVSPNSVCGIHTYGRRLEQKELGSNLDMSETTETGWTARDNSSVKSFAILHGGKFELNLKLKIEISNHNNQKLVINKNIYLAPFGTFLVVPQNLSDYVVEHLNDKKGYIKVYISGLSGVFPRMLCGNFLTNSNNSSEIINAEEIQFTHTNFDFSSIEQPDAEGNFGYFNQPSIPQGYGIVYPVETKKIISIDKKNYQSNSLHHIEINEMSQVDIVAQKENLPSRFVAATIGRWKNAQIESECSTGTFIEDYLKVPCHWHWGLLKPSLDNGEGIISIVVGKFNRNEDISRTLKLRLFDNKKLIIEKNIFIDEHKKISTANLLSKNLLNSAIWYVLSGDKLEDLNIFSTFYPENKAGFVEHAF
ncbi:hypothetical protein IDH35_02705 [Pelagibacterales bacterium SAG-MED49]|nr:hypothetical protein [Pelagibacterales bacterium SAG-MED49]